MDCPIDRAVVVLEEALKDLKILRKKQTSTMSTTHPSPKPAGRPSSFPTTSDMKWVDSLRQ